MASTKELYTVLGVDETASDAEIKSAYERLIAENPEGSPKFASISQAYAVLSDMDRRAAYDVTGKYKAVRRHRTSPEDGSRILKVRSTLNSLFLAGAAVTTVCFIMHWGGSWSAVPFYWTCGVSLLLKVAEYILRLVP